MSIIFVVVVSYNPLFLLLSHSVSRVSAVAFWFSLWDCVDQHSSMVSVRYFFLLSLLSQEMPCDFLC